MRRDATEPDGAERNGNICTQGLDLTVDLFQIYHSKILGEFETRDRMSERNVTTEALIVFEMQLSKVKSQYARFGEYTTNVPLRSWMLKLFRKVTTIHWLRGTRIRTISCRMGGEECE